MLSLTIASAAFLRPGGLVNRPTAVPSKRTFHPSADASVDREALERMLWVGEATPEAPTLGVGGVLQDLPLWRVQWSVLPGFNQLLHVRHSSSNLVCLGRLVQTNRPVMLAGPCPALHRHVLTTRAPA